MAPEPVTLTRTTIRTLLKRAGLNVQQVHTTDFGYYTKDGKKVDRPTLTVRNSTNRNRLVVDLYGVEVAGDGTIGDNERTIAATDAAYAEHLTHVVDVLAEFGVTAKRSARHVQIETEQVPDQARPTPRVDLLQDRDLPFSVVTIDTEDDSYQSAGPFGTREAAEQYARELDGQINDHPGGTRVIIKVAKHFPVPHPGFGVEHITLVPEKS